MRKSLKTAVSSLPTIDNAIRVYVCVTLIGPIACGITMGVNLHSGARSNAGLIADLLFNMSVCMIGLIKMPQILLRLPLKGVCSTPVKIDLLAYVFYALIAMLVTMGIAGQAMLARSPWCDIFAALGLIIIIPTTIIYFICWVVMIWERVRPAH